MQVAFRGHPSNWSVLLYTPVDKLIASNHSGGNTMKQFKQESLPYPNAATRKDILNKVLDKLLIAATSTAITTGFLFLLTL